jgi:DNA-3-methyladenine glycosylase II
MATRLRKADRERLEALAASDPAMEALIERHGPLSIEHRRAERPEDPFEVLMRTIVGQQVSTAAARTVWDRVVVAFGGSPPTPEQAIAGVEELRACGLSGRKVSYIEGLAEMAASGELELDRLGEMSDEEVIDALVAVRGLGRWSAEMFLMFHLARPDVFSGGDLGLRNGIGIALGLEEPPGPKEAVEIAERWRPNRTLASIYLWEAVHAKPME